MQGTFVTHDSMGFNTQLKAMFQGLNSSGTWNQSSDDKNHSQSLKKYMPNILKQSLANNKSRTEMQ